MNRNTLWIGLLLASVLANGVLAGVLIQRASTSAVVQAEPDETMRGGGRFRPRSFLQALPEDRRDESRDRLRAGMRDAAPLMRAAVRARRNALAALAAEPFDADTAVQAMADARMARGALDTHVERIVLSIVAELPPAERRVALEAAWSGGPPEDRRRRRPRGLDRPPHGEPPPGP
ncbi:MAG: periplasmic heavy metal sensor [Pseudomonadota bacterium]